MTPQDPFNITPKFSTEDWIAIILMFIIYGIGFSFLLLAMVKYFS